MSQISASSPLSRASADRAEPLADRAGETVDAGFAALLAGLFPPPVAPGPALPQRALGEAPTAPLADDAAADDPLPDAAPDAEPDAEPGATEKPPAIDGGLEPFPDGDQPAVLDRGPRGAIPAPGEAQTPSASPSREAAPPADLPRAEAGAVASGPTSTGETTRPKAGRAKAAAAAQRATDGSAAASAPTATGTGRGEAAADRSTAVTGAPVDQMAAFGPRPVFGRHVLARFAWDAELVARQEIAISSGAVPVLDRVGGIGERATLASAEAVAGGPARPVQQLALAIERAVKGEIRQLTIQLSPRDLGTIEIALDLDAERRLTVAILAERPETLELLRQDARQLERLLGQHGLNLAEAGLELGLMDSERRKGGERPPPDRLDLALPEEASGSGADGPPPPPAAADAGHRLNLSI
jgi:flagellar hook-length control protein FliK